MRKFLLRILLAWWLIVLIWIVLFPMAYLLSGYRYSTESLMELTHDFWYGLE